MRHLNLPTSSSAGFTLVEFMIAILLLVVGVLAALSMVSTSINANSSANILSVKTALAQQAMEYILSLDPASGECDPYLGQKPVDVFPTPDSKARAFNLNTSTSSTCPGVFVDDEGKAVTNGNKTVQGAGILSATYTASTTGTSGLTQIVINVESVTPNPNQRKPVTMICLKRVD